MRVSGLIWRRLFMGLVRNFFDNELFFTTRWGGGAVNRKERRFLPWWEKRIWSQHSPEATLEQTAWFPARHMTVLGESQHSPPCRKNDPYLNQRAAARAPFISLHKAGRRIRSPSALPSTYQRDSLSFDQTTTCFGRRPVAHGIRTLARSQQVRRAYFSGRQSPGSGLRRGCARKQPAASPQK